MEGPVDKSVASIAVEKERKLKQILVEMESSLIAFSGGVDSAYLAVVAREIPGHRTLAVTGESPSYPEHQRRLALEVVERFGLSHCFIETNEMEDPRYQANGPDRCFHCKSELYGKLRAIAEKESFRFILDGANADDRTDYRPGRKAAKLMGVRSPLDEAELTKEEIRHLSRARGLPTADEPASACLSSRIPYFTPVTIENLSSVERGEEALRALGFRQTRVRHHGELARLELAPEEISRALSPELKPLILEALKKLGYRYVALDLEGYRTGSLNEALSWPSRSESRAPGTPTTGTGAASK